MTPFEFFVGIIVLGHGIAGAIIPWWTDKRRWDRMRKADWRDNPPVRG